MLVSIIIVKLAIANYKPHCYEGIDLCNNVFAVFASGVCTCTGIQGDDLLRVVGRKRSEAPRNNPVDFSFKLHVDLLPFAYIFIAAEDNIALYKNDSAKSYSNGCSMGGGLGFKLLNGVKGKHALDVRVKSLSTLGSPDWKRNTYDASLAWYLKTEKISPIVELGYRYLDSRTKGIDNYGNAYLTIGLRY